MSIPLYQFFKMSRELNSIGNKKSFYTKPIFFDRSDKDIINILMTESVINKIKRIYGFKICSVHLDEDYIKKFIKKLSGGFYIKPRISSEEK